MLRSLPLLFRQTCGEVPRKRVKFLLNVDMETKPVFMAISSRDEAVPFIRRQASRIHTLLTYSMGVSCMFFKKNLRKCVSLRPQTAARSPTRSCSA